MQGRPGPGLAAQEQLGRCSLHPNTHTHTPSFYSLSFSSQTSHTLFFSLAVSNLLKPNSHDRLFRSLKKTALFLSFLQLFSLFLRTSNHLLSLELHCAQLNRPYWLCFDRSTAHQARLLLHTVWVTRDSPLLSPWALLLAQTQRSTCPTHTSSNGCLYGSRA